MKKRLMLVLMLVLCAALLCACSKDSGTQINVNGGQQGQAQQGQPQQGQTQQQGNAYPGAEGMNPLAEEDDYSDGDWPDLVVPEPDVVAPTAAPTMRSEYAGATPVILDPIDKPTPTPVPKLAVSYTDYDATKLGLSFQGPVGWTVDDSAKDTFIIQNPDARMDYAATLTLRIKKVSEDYSTSSLKSEVQAMLNAIGTVGFEDYNPSRTDTRELLGKTGVYANYNGVLADGTRIAGRVHVVCVDKVVYTLHLTTPYEQWEDYKEMVYDRLRDTIKITK